MKIKYQNIKMGADRLAMVARVNQIVAEYRAQGYVLTLRQVYYQFVSRGWIDNKQKEYKRLGDIINDGRMAGLVDWEAIEDRTRELDGNQHWTNPQSIIDAVAASYMIDKWADQPYRLEVWVEKDALEGVVGQTARALDIDFFSCRGYASQTSMHDHAQRLRGYIAKGQHPIILHFGDHDPSGIDMSRDIKDRLNGFLIQDWLNNNMKAKGTVKVKDILEDIRQTCGYPGIQVKRIALTMEQIKRYNPPPNPAKATDARYKGYQEEHGEESWELDALEPRVIDRLIRSEVESYRKEDRFNFLLKREQTERELLQETSTRWEDVVDFLQE